MRANNWFYWLSRNCVKVGFVLFTRMRVVDEKKVPRKGGVILVSNHISHLDPPLVGVTCSRKVHFLAKKELFRGAFLRWYLINSGQIPVDRGKGREAVEVAVNILKEGNCICIFPEGTRSRTGEMMDPHTGVVVIASKADVPLVPIYIRGTFEAMPPKKSFPKLFMSVKITYGDPFNLTEEQKDLSSKEIMKKTAGEIMERIKALDK